MATEATTAAAATTAARFDPSSFADPSKVASRHVHLVWNVDFKSSTLSGSATITAVVQDASAESLVLDTNGEIISKVTVGGTAGDKTVDAEEATVTMGKASEALGVPCEVPIPAALRVKDAQLTVTIEYATATTASALQWLTKEQTADKTHPYLFSQCQAIHARSLFPCQDSPGLKLTYSAEVTVPNGMTALMSALNDGNTTTGDVTVFKFKQPVAVPTYLVAIAVGKLASRDIGPRSCVWAEPSVVDKAANEFADTERFISEGEKLLTPYVWTRYDILCMPPSFPYGGMENPCLTFVTPTLLAGDRSLADVICHEIAHSWTGNLVTTKNWEHFWLNEGCTMWVQRKIMERLHGDKFFDFDAMIGLKMLQDDVAQLGASNPLTALVPKLDNVDPDDAFSSVPYEKGFLFHYYLQTVVGGAAAYDPWFKSYIEHFSHKVLSSYDFKDFFMAHFEGKADVSVIDWDAWFNTPGMPIWEHKYDMTLRNACEALAGQWVAGGEEAKTADDWTSMTPGQQIATLEVMLNAQSSAAESKEESKINDHAVLARMDELYTLTNCGNAEIRFRWQTLCLKAGYESIVPAVVAFISEQGRMKFVRPLYRELFKTSFGKDVAIATFKANKDNLHPIASKMVATDLGQRSKA